MDDSLIGIKCSLNNIFHEKMNGIKLMTPDELVDILYFPSTFKHALNTKFIGKMASVSMCEMDEILDSFDKVITLFRKELDSKGVKEIYVIKSPEINVYIDLLILGKISNDIDKCKRFYSVFSSFVIEDR